MGIKFKKISQHRGKIENQRKQRIKTKDETLMIEMQERNKRLQSQYRKNSDRKNSIEEMETEEEYENWFYRIRQYG